MIATLPKPIIKIPLAEGVYTIQGEGTFQGCAAYFIRLGGCNLGCPWCDTKHTWNAANYPSVSVEKITQQAIESGCSMVVVTGGEPTLYNLTELTKCLKQRGLRTHLETAGAYPLTGKWDWICLSPKKTTPPLSSAYRRADELKVVVCDKDDFMWAEQCMEKVTKRCALFLQPEWSRKEQVTPLIFDYVRKNPQWKISLQIHKYLRIP